MKITLQFKRRKQPKIGDRRTTKKHGLQIRVVATSEGMWIKSGSRYRHEWRKPDDLVGSQFEHLLTQADRETIRAGGQQ